MSTDEGYRAAAAAYVQQRISRNAETGCWEWTGPLNRGGYARLHGKEWGYWTAHRMAYESLRGPIPEGMQLDHLCRVRHCVNPQHLEPVTSRINSLRSPVTHAGVNARKTHCIHGHGLTAENVYQWRGSRHCRACRADRVRARAAARKAS